MSQTYRVEPNTNPCIQIYTILSPVSMRSCAVGKYSARGSDRCEECGAPSSLAKRTAESQQVFGDSAPRGIDCAGGVLVGTLPGHWSAKRLTALNANETHTWSCKEEKYGDNSTGRCLGGPDNLCRTGHDESHPMCARW